MALLKNIERPHHHPATYGIKYAGAKTKLLRDIAKIIHPLNITTIFDAFSGTTRVSQFWHRLAIK